MRSALLAALLVVGCAREPLPMPDAGDAGARDAAAIFDGSDDAFCAGAALPCPDLAPCGVAQPCAPDLALCTCTATTISSDCLTPYGAPWCAEGECCARTDGGR